ncbi:hypothetical protein GLGR_1879 [Leminorella grimontii ATCC 33999 = DSM 5078]|nr:hypothetical protein GLGR_1879 [Leminorella grimontii ATCC 33999 = DSM 5078]
MPIYDLLREYDYNNDTLAVYMYVPKAKETRYWSGTVSFSDTVTTSINQVETVNVVINVQSPAVTFYKDEKINQGS